METLILNSNSEKDIALLLEIAKKYGLDLKVVPQATKKSSLGARRDELIALAKSADASVKPNKITMQEIVDEVNIVRQENYDKRNKDSNRH